MTDTTTVTEHTNITTPVHSSESDLEKQSQTTKDWPDCWTYDQKNDFCLKNEWLCVCRMKLGCTACRKVGPLGVETKMGMKVSKEWAKNEITYCGKAHEKIITAKIFRTAYKVAKENQSFHHFETEIDLQELNGVEMGRILHSTNACINIVNHISEEMRKTVVKKIVQSNNKISLIIDESTTISKITTLIVYVQCCIEGVGMNAPINLFLDIVELEKVTADAAVMLGCKSGVKKLLSERFPSIIVWHCANHRLELSVGDAVKETSGINRSKSFIDKLYVIYHASAKNSRELHLCAELLGAELLKIGRILSTRWVSSSLRTVLAVWNNFESLVCHFEQAMHDPTRDKNDKCTYDGLKRKITSTEFSLDLELMCDALQELSELSLDLQDRNIDLYKANKKIKILVQVFEERRQNPGPYYKCAVAAVHDLHFHGVLLHAKDLRKDPPIDPNTFYTKLKESIEKRLLDSKDDELAYWSRVLDQKHWPEDVNTQLTFGEVEIRNLSIRLQLNEREMIRGFREYILEKTYPEKLLHLIRTLNTIPISSSECERGFSQMNLIVTPTRASLKTKTISALLFIKLVGPPLRLFDPSKYVDLWLLRGRHSAIDTNSKERSREDLLDENWTKLWNLL
ncbi:E3 SUMO-protein ligase KIAA1586-like [Tiliqua scincoides]|uniref:E3 SUMO-protein ligase KIAA1586-like n=1 Tax=Tiliqua scincoides TaxID=71010 RepID=UPI0034628C73